MSRSAHGGSGVDVVKTMVGLLAEWQTLELASSSGSEPVKIWNIINEGEKGWEALHGEVYLLTNKHAMTAGPWLLANQ